MHCTAFGPLVRLHTTQSQLLSAGGDVEELCWFIGRLCSSFDGGPFFCEACCCRCCFCCWGGAHPVLVVLALALVAAPDDDPVVSMFAAPALTAAFVTTMTGSP